MKRVTIRDLSKEVGLSLGAINKALNNKPGLSDETREKILKTAEKMGYRVNRVAQSLARNTIMIGVILPDVWPEYVNYLEAGINKELNALRDYNVLGKFYSVPSLHSGKEMVEVIKECEKDGMNAIIVFPNHDTEYENEIDKLYKRGIPVVALGSDFTYCRRLSCVRVNALASGRLASEYMRWMVGEGGKVAVLIGNKDFNDHREKVEGFQKEAEVCGIKVVGVYETNDQPEIAYHITDKLIRGMQDLVGIYVATGNSLAVCRRIVENRAKAIHVVGTDIFHDIIEFVKDGTMQGVIFQDTVRQGEIAVRLIYRHLANSKAVEDNVLVKPQLVLRSNIDDYYIEYANK